MPPREESSSVGELLTRTGERLMASGIYEALHASEEQASVKIVGVAGEIAPRCKHCGKNVRWRLTYAAPHIYEDEDFGPDGTKQ